MPLLLLLFLFSGATGLVYELIWTRELIFVFGGTTFAITTVLVGFMGGLGLGSFLAGRVAARLRRPAWVYGWLEIGIGVYALCVPMLLGLAAPLYRVLYPLVADSPFWLNAARFMVGSTIMVIPATAMGATLPILVTYANRAGLGVGRAAALMFGINTFGAVLGVSLTGFVLIPTLGLRTTTLVAAAANLLIGLIAITRFGSVAATDDSDPGERDDAAETAARPSLRRGLMEPVDERLSDAAWRATLLAYAVSGFTSMVYQVAWTRALVMTIGSSTYAFTCILSAFILGLALGGLIVGRFIDRVTRPLAALGLIQAGIGLSAVCIAALLGRLPLLMPALIERFGKDFGALLVVEFGLVICVMLVPTLLMGAAFPFVTRLLATRARGVGDAAGRAYGVNTIGTILGSFLAGFVLIRSDIGLGVQNSIFAAALLNAGVGVLLALQARREYATHRTWWTTIAGAAAVPAAFSLGGAWDPILLNAGLFRGSPQAREYMQRYELLFLAEGPDLTATILQVDGDKDQLSLTVNGKADASTTFSDLPNMVMVGHVGAFFTEQRKSACVIGLGGGMTLAGVARHPFERIDCVEISKEVIDAATYFAPFTYDVMSDPRVRMFRADGRNHLALTRERYDLIVSQPSNPWMAGVSNLFTREYFELCRRALQPGGVMVAWLQAYATTPEDFQMVTRTLTEVFPFVTVWDAAGYEYMFIAAERPFMMPVDEIALRYYDPVVRADLLRAGVEHPGRILGEFIAGDEVLRAWSASAPLHTDDNALLEFSAPRAMYSDYLAEIGQAMLALQGDPYDSRVAVPSGHPALDADVRLMTERVRFARERRNAAIEMLWANDRPAAWRTFLDAHYVDRGNVGVLSAIQTELHQMFAAVPNILEHPQHAPAIRAMMDTRDPFLADRRGGTVEDAFERNMRLGRQAYSETLFGRAIDHFEGARAIDPTRDEALELLAYSYARIEALDVAIDLIDGLIQAQPGNGSAHFIRAQFAVFADDFPTAVAHLEQVVELGLMTRSELSSQPALAPLRGDPAFQALIGADTD